ncbi:sensor domain-containing diguanylate cyclase [Noviherbaspirillum pedocola]|uniref:diguanylate cyclase n=1 Tax=Noviherbaspirillum pedocola TaxID=2801341 RepID=A0A934SXH5_9BURK|nr:diguanylate cyclase [Noviherbaspirillum pedocola]MBK4734672.1 diguanylate cyclase [Noviherbaspirillum pedocola]
MRHLESFVLKTFLKSKAGLLAIVITTLVASATALEISLDYRDTERRAYETASDITRVVERQVRDTITYVDQTLDAVSTLVRKSGNIASIREPTTWQILRSYCTTLIGCHAIGVIDPVGKVKAQTQNTDTDVLDVSDRLHFLRPRETGKRYIDAATVSRLSGSPILFFVSKPVFDTRGKLLAVATIGMETRQLTSFYSLFGFSLAPAISIFKGDGGIVARNPGMEKLVGKSNAKSEIFTRYLPRAPFGTFKSISRLDGKTRLAAYRALPDLDLVVFSGIETPAAFAAWKARSLRQVTIVAGMLILIWGALLAASRATAGQAVLRQKNQHLDTLASRDPLTGIGNRRLFARTLRRDWSKHARSGAPLSLVLLDVDYFKLFNDHYGHQAGDDCLRRVAHALQECLQREGDLVARYGGEEFVAVLDCDHEGALRVAERMRQRVEALEIPHIRSKACDFVTASFGVASTESTRTQTAEELLGLADKALYEAKANGRNQVCAVKASSSTTEVKTGT